MKIRTGFVSNSSSSSFLVIRCGDVTILEDSDDIEDSHISCNIDDIITKLNEAKSSGETMVHISYGGSYDG